MPEVTLTVEQRHEKVRQFNCRSPLNVLGTAAAGIYASVSGTVPSIFVIEIGIAVLYLQQVLEIPM